MAVSRDRIFALCCTALLIVSLGVHVFELRRIKALSAPADAMSPRSTVPRGWIRATPDTGQGPSWGKRRSPLWAGTAAHSCVCFQAIVRMVQA